MNDAAPALRPLSLLEQVAAMDHPVTFVEIAGETDLPRPTVHRWLNALTEAGLLQRTPDGRRYELAPRSVALAFAILSNGPAASARRSILERLAAEVGEACNFTVLDGAQVTYVDRVESKWPLRITFQRGSRVPVHCSASGKLFLALMAPAQRERILKDLPFERATANTIVDRAAFEAELAAVRKAGHALDREEFLDGLVCLAVPISQQVGRRKTCVAALAIQAPTSRVSQAAIVERLPALREAAQALEATLE